MPGSKPDVSAASAAEKPQRYRTLGAWTAIPFAVDNWMAAEVRWFRERCGPGHHEKD